MSEPVGVQVGQACPRCGREESVPLLWGLPSPDAFSHAAPGDVVAGGCVIFPDDPAHVLGLSGVRSRVRARR
ncbi:hypothetical protein [Blastococcus montanus]|uniref:hypothetical protein n=1 Tax=Blastococcus montanus TaxID=3144973 RepID=UPI00320ABF9D